MTNGLNRKDQELLRIIGEVLHYVWDPIGVAGEPQARDEYDGYIGPVFTLLRSGASHSEISTHLATIASECMGLPAAKELAETAATVLIDRRDHQDESEA